MESNHLPLRKREIDDVEMESIRHMQSEFAEEITRRFDTVINPYVSSVSWFEFDKLDWFVREHYRCVQNQIDEIESLNHFGES